MNGKYIKQIGTFGRSSDEYLGILSFCIDPGKKEIYLMDYWKYRLLKYRIGDGKLLDKINLPNDISYSSIVFVEGCIYASITHDNYEDNDNLLLKIDLKTGKFKEYLSAKKIFNTNSNVQSGCFIASSPPKYGRFYANTLFSCKKDSVYPYIAVKSNDWVKGSDVYDDNSLSDFIKNDRAFIISPNNYYENDICVHFDYRKGKNGYHIVHNKQTGATYHYRSIVNDINYSGKDSEVNYYNIMSINSKFAYDMMFSEPTLDFLRDGKFSPELAKQLELLNLDKEGYVILEYEFK
jgi:hypothetical protein